MFGVVMGGVHLRQGALIDGGCGHESVIDGQGDVVPDLKELC